MTDKQRQMMLEVMGNATDQFLSVGYPAILSIVAGHQAAMLMAWGLDSDAKSLSQAADLMFHFQQRFVVVTPLEKGNLN